MTRLHLSLALMAAVCSATPRLAAQTFDAGSTGAYGAMNVTTDTTLNLPADGVFNCTTITVAVNKTLRFNRNALNTPVHLLATGDVNINGTIEISGSAPSSNASSGGIGGPGGFDGGNPGFNGTDVPPGAGYGPGGGKGGLPYTSGANANNAGNGSYATVASYSYAQSNNNGATYGSRLLIPLVGGSGGGGTSGPSATANGYGGGGGGGALLVASNTKINLPSNGSIRAYGGYPGASSYVGAGSGGAVRLLAPSVFGSGYIYATSTGYAGDGRIRIDSIYRSDSSNSNNTLNINCNPGASLGSFMLAFLPNAPRLDITQAADTTIAEGTGVPVNVLLPTNSSPNRTVTVQARNFSATVPIRVVLTPDNGAPVTYDSQINNTGTGAATTTVSVVFPVNTNVNVSAWTR